MKKKNQNQIVIPPATPRRFYGHGIPGVALDELVGKLIAVEGAGHNDIHRFPSYLDALAARLIAAGAPPLAKR